MLRIRNQKAVLAALKNTQGGILSQSLRQHNLTKCPIPTNTNRYQSTNTVDQNVDLNASNIIRNKAKSTQDSTIVEDGNSLDSFTDEQVDEWIKSIHELKSEFNRNGFDPETSLAGPGQAKIDLAKEAEKIRTPEFVPTREQIEEYERLQNIPIPKIKDPVLEHVINMTMRHGKKELAQKIISRALYLVFCQTRKDPLEQLKKSLDDLAPLMIVRTFNTGVAKAAVVPVPLNQRQRNRIAWKWIVEGANKRASSDFAVRLGEELVAISKGVGSGFDKRDQIHKAAIAHRAYIKLK